MTNKEWVTTTVGELWDWEVNIENCDHGFSVQAVERTEDSEGNFCLVFRSLQKEENFADSEEEAWANAKEMLLNKLEEELGDLEGMIQNMRECVEKAPTAKSALKLVTNKSPMN